MPKRNLNNGQPSLHAALIAAAAPQPGEHIVHVGAGVGYYTAIIAGLVGATGRVTAIEFDPGLAARATANFAQTPHVRAVHGDGTRGMFEPADVIYVNAGATRPADMAGSAEGGGKADPAGDGGRITEPRRAARGRVPDRTARPGILCAPALWGRDLSL
jgi:protein-L-isoaspartate(D-aspartate) O-methyltransferase